MAAVGFFFTSFQHYLTKIKSCDTTVTQVISCSFREEGFRFLFKGWTPSFIRLGPNTVLMFVFYEVRSFLWENKCSNHLLMICSATQESLEDDNIDFTIY